MTEKQKQTWVVRYLRIDSDTRRLPMSFTCTIESDYDGEAKHLALSAFHRFVLDHQLNVLFLDSEKI